jgi:hypothetical protein
MEEGYDMQGLPELGSRLITQNLVMSAASAQEAEKPDWSSIYDLAVLIDLFCMYDSAIVLGRLVNSVAGSAIGNLLLRTGFLKIAYPEIASVPTISKAAKGHLLTYLGQRDVGGRFDDVLRFALSFNQAAYSFCSKPDRQEVIECGDMWLKTAPTTEDLLQQLQRESKDIAWGATFLVRSFLYIGYAEVNDLVLVPDAIRSSVVDGVVSAEDEVRIQLLQSIASTPGGATTTAAHQGLRRVSPLAAVVFERATPNRQGIADVMDNMRSELEPLRKRLREAEDKIFYGKGNEVTDAVSWWGMVADELGKTYGTDPHLVSLESVLRFGGNIGDLADEPTKSKTWMAVLLGLPFDILKRVILRRPAIELHRIKRDLPGTSRLKAAVVNMFGADIAPS